MRVNEPPGSFPGNTGATTTCLASKSTRRVLFCTFSLSTTWVTPEALKLIVLKPYHRDGND